VLAPELPDAHAGPDGEDPAQEGPDTAVESAPATTVSGEDHLDGDERLAGSSQVAQETVELDMLAVMEDDPDAADVARDVAPADGGVRAANSAHAPEQDSRDREASNEAPPEPGPEDVPGQGRLSFE
jgi:hypothetical protein